MPDHNDYQPPEKQILTDEQWLSAHKESMKGFHGKYDRKTGRNKPTSRNYTFTPIRYGTPDVPDKYKPSYSKITNKNTVYDNVTCKKHIVEIIENSVFFNGSLIATDPEKSSDGKKKTKTQKQNFCKAVIYSIIPGEIKTGDYHKEITTISDDSELRRYAALLKKDAINGLTYITQKDAEKVLKAKEWEYDYVVRSV